jgi:PAS domain S-box-containing protein
VRSYLTYRLRRLSIPVLAISLALIARFLLDPVLHGRMPYGLFIIAVILTARLADTWETLVALILGFVLAGWFFVEPRSSLFISGATAWLSAACYLFIGLSIVWIARTGHAAHVRELTSAVQLRKYQEELELEKAHHRQTQAMRGMFSQVLDGLEAAIIGLNEKGEIVTWNAAAERFFGYSANEAVGQPISFLFSPGIGPAELAMLEQMSPGKRIERQITIRNRRDGSQTEVFLAISSIHDSTGKLKGACLIARPAQVLHS